MSTLNNPWMNLYVEADGKIFKVVHVTRTIEAVNAFCAGREDCGLIATDDSGNHYIALLKSN